MNQIKLIDKESKVINWDRVDYLCAQIIKCGTIVMVTIAVCWGVWWELAKTFGGI